MIPILIRVYTHLRLISNSHIWRLANFVSHKHNHSPPPLDNHQCQLVVSASVLCAADALRCGAVALCISACVWGLCAYLCVEMSSKWANIMRIDHAAMHTAVAAAALGCTIRATRNHLPHIMCSRSLCIHRHTGAHTHTHTRMQTYAFTLRTLIVRRHILFVASTATKRRYYMSVYVVHDVGST